MKGPGGGSPWDVPGLGVDVGALLGDVAPPRPAARPSTAPRASMSAPSDDARALVGSSPQLTENVERCQNALGTARSSVREAFGTGRKQESAEVQAWLALMDEVLNFGEALTGVLLSQKARRAPPGS